MHQPTLRQITFNSGHTIGDEPIAKGENPNDGRVIAICAPEKLDYQAITTEAQFAALLDKLSQADTIGIDTKPPP